MQSILKYLFKLNVNVLNTLIPNIEKYKYIYTREKYLKHLKNITSKSIYLNRINILNRILHTMTYLQKHLLKIQ